MSDWNKKPTINNFWNKDMDYIVFLDENNCEDTTYIKKKILDKLPIDKDENFFTLTGCIISPQEYVKLKNSFLKLKFKYWENGKYYNKNNQLTYVCFHSNDIRRKQIPFNDNLINCEIFGKELFETIKSIDFNIISITINIYEYLIQNCGLNLYHTSCDILLKQLQNFLPNSQKIALMFEARGKKEDLNLHKHICSIIGTDTIKKISNKIVGVYFNPKWKNENTPPYAGLELADLCSYPIHKYIKNGTKDKSFLAIEQKLAYYPDYINSGIKIFPTKK